MPVLRVFHGWRDSFLLSMRVMHPDGRPLDTTPEAWELYLDHFRRMSVSDKLQLTFELSDNLRNVVEAGGRLQYPHASEREVFLRTTARYLGRETMMKVYHWDPDADAPIPEWP